MFDRPLALNNAHHMLPLELAQLVNSQHFSDVTFVVEGKVCGFFLSENFVLIVILEKKCKRKLEGVFSGNE